jgi:adenylate cyclase
MDALKPITRLSAVLSADIVGYSRLRGSDSEGTVAQLAGHRATIERVIEQHAGRLVDFVGDNFLAEFSSASTAVECALEIQDKMASANTGLDSRSKMLLRMGLHLGEVRAEGERIFGSAINIAARIESATEPGGVCISETMQQQLSASPKFALDDLGLQEFKNIDRSVRIFRVRHSDTSPQIDSGPGARREADQTPSIAVLPFANMSPDPDQEYFGDGMAEEIINALAQVPGLRVIARTSAFRFKGTSTDIRSIGQILGVGVVVEGSVRRAGNRLRITAQLVETGAGHHLWSKVFDRDADNIFAIQDEIARNIVDTVLPKLLPELAASEPIVEAPTENQQAYDLYLRAGRRLAHFNLWDTKLAVTMLEDAIELDSGFAAAWSRLGSACCVMEFSFDPDGDWINKAEHAADQALLLNRRNAEAEYVRGRLLWSPRQGFQHLDALAALDRSLEVQPGGPDARMWRSLILLHLGIFDEAETGLQEVLAADPDNGMALQSTGQLYAFSGRFDEARKYHERALEVEPGNFYTRAFFPVFHLYADDLTAAERELEKSRVLLPDEPLLDLTEALLWARRGESQRAEEAIERGERSKRSVGHRHHSDHFAACALTLLGDADRAVARLTQAADTGFPNYPLFRSDKHLRRLQDANPAMKTLMQRLKVQWEQYRSFVHR